MITDYTTLRQAILDWLNRNGFSDLEAQIETFSQLAQVRINRDVKTRHFTGSAPVTYDSDTIAVSTAPDTASELRALVLNLSQSNVQLTPLAVTQILGQQAVLGVPRSFAVLSQSGTTVTLAIAPAPQSEATGTMYYYIADPALSESVSTNVTVTNFPDLLLNACLLEASIFLKDDARSRVWGERYATRLAEIKKDDDKFSRPSGTGHVVNSDIQAAYPGVLP